MSLSRLLVLTDRGQSAAAGRSLAETVSAVLGAASPAVLLREKDLAPEERFELGSEIAELVASAGAVLIVASDRALGERLGAQGIHLAAHDPWIPLTDRDFLVGRSCHDTEELHRAIQTGASYVTISPVYSSKSKPDYGPALGTDVLRSLIAHAPTPVPTFALGGLAPGRVSECLRAGAHGVAVMGAVMGAEDPEEVVRALMDEIDRTTEDLGPQPAVDLPWRP